MRKLNFFEKFKIYFNASVFIIGEFSLLAGLIAMFTYSRTIELLIGLVLLAIGLYIIRKKILVLRTGILAIKEGSKTNAILTDISNSFLEHNDRVVKIYAFKYEVNNSFYFYKFKSAYHRELKVGDKKVIFYLANCPEKGLIPEFYKITS